VGALVSRRPVKSTDAGASASTTFRIPGNGYVVRWRSSEHHAEPLAVANSWR
jgi:hypothetical protein